MLFKLIGKDPHLIKKSLKIQIQKLKSNIKLISETMNKRTLNSRSKSAQSQGSGTVAIFIAFVALAFILFTAMTSV